MKDIDVRDEPDANRYTVHVDGKPVGLLAYRLRTDRISFTHAEVDRAYGGQGVGSALAKSALDDARTRGLAVLPDCPFMTSYVQKNREYEDLVPVDLRNRYGLA